MKALAVLVIVAGVLIGSALARSASIPEGSYRLAPPEDGTEASADGRWIDLLRQQRLEKRIGGDWVPIPIVGPISCGLVGDGAGVRVAVPRP